MFFIKSEKSFVFLILHNFYQLVLKLDYSAILKSASELLH